MPFDSTPCLESPSQLDAGGYSLSAFPVNSTNSKPDNVGPLGVWHPLRRPENVNSTIALLGRARALIADRRHWCQGTFARSWANIPVRPHSMFALRFCAIGALNRAAYELLLPTETAYIALEWQAGRRVEGWNDDPTRRHAEVVSLFDAAIHRLRQVTE